MHNTRTDVFAFRNSGLEAFLCADVGAEPNGSDLNVLSMIARLDRDPWEEALGWASLPRPAAVEQLACAIGQMLLVPSALAGAHVTAARLVQLLPASAPMTRQAGPAKANPAAVPGWLPITMLYCAMAVGMTLSALLAPRPPKSVDTASEAALMVPGSGKAPIVQVEPAAGSAAVPAGPLIR